MHALIVDLDLTLLAGEAGPVKEQLLRPHHLGLKDPASTSWAGIITAPLEKTWVRALRGWGWARCAVPAVDLLVLPHEHLKGDQYFQIWATRRGNLEFVVERALAGFAREAGGVEVSALLHHLGNSKTRIEKSPLSQK